MESLGHGLSILFIFVVLPVANFPFIAVFLILASILAGRHMLPEPWAVRGGIRLLRGWLVFLVIASVMEAWPEIVGFFDGSASGIKTVWGTLFVVLWICFPYVVAHCLIGLGWLFWLLAKDRASVLVLPLLPLVLTGVALLFVPFGLASGVFALATMGFGWGFGLPLLPRWSQWRDILGPKDAS